MNDLRSSHVQCSPPNTLICMLLMSLKVCFRMVILFLRMWDVAAIWGVEWYKRSLIWTGLTLKSRTCLWDGVHSFTRQQTEFFQADLQSTHCTTCHTLYCWVSPLCWPAQFQEPNCGASSNLGGLAFMHMVFFCSLFAHFAGERAIWEYLVAFFCVSAC